MSEICSVCLNLMGSCRNLDSRNIYETDYYTSEMFWWLWQKHSGFSFIGPTIMVKMLHDCMWVLKITGLKIIPFILVLIYMK